MRKENYRTPKAENAAKTGKTSKSKNYSKRTKLCHEVSQMKQLVVNGHYVSHDATIEFLALAFQLINDRKLDKRIDKFRATLKPHCIVDTCELFEIIKRIQRCICELAETDSCSSSEHQASGEVSKEVTDSTQDASGTTLANTTGAYADGKDHVNINKFPLPKDMIQSYEGLMHTVACFENLPFEDVNLTDDTEGSNIQQTTGRRAGILRIFLRKIVQQLKK